MCRIDDDGVCAWGDHTLHYRTQEQRAILLLTCLPTCPTYQTWEECTVIPCASCPNKEAFLTWV